jgi:hypothetical protein
VPLVGVRELKSDTKILTFALPAGVSLDLPPASCLQVQVCVCARVFLCVYVCIRVCVYIRVCIRVCLNIHIYV